MCLKESDSSLHFCDLDFTLKTELQLVLCNIWMRTVMKDLEMMNLTIEEAQKLAATDNSGERSFALCAVRTKVLRLNDKTIVMPHPP